MLDEQVERLLADLDARSQQEIQQVRADAEASARRMAEDTERRKTDRRAEVLRFVEAEGAAQRVQALAEARRTALGDLLRSQYAAVDQVLAAAGALVQRRLAAAGELPGLADRLAALLEYIAPSPARIRCRPEMLERVRAAIPAGAAVAVEPSADGPSGFVLTDASGHVTVDDTVDAWLARERPQVAIELRLAMEAGA